MTRTHTATATAAEMILAGLLLAPKSTVPVVVDVAIVPVPGVPAGPVVDVTLEPTGADVFGEPVPGEAVQSRNPIDPCTAYAPRWLRGRFGRRLDGKPVRLPTGPK